MAGVSAPAFHQMQSRKGYNMILETVKIMPSSPEQGDYVLINKDDFNPEVHTLYGQAPESTMTKVELQALLTPAL